MVALSKQTLVGTSGTPVTARRVARSRNWVLAVLTAVAALAAGVGILAPTPAAAQVQPASPGAARGTVHRHLGVPYTAHVMTVLDASLSGGAPVVTGYASGRLADGWGLVNTGAGSGVYQLRNLRSGLCLEMPGALAPAGAAAQQYRCDPNYKNQPNQLWKLLPKGGKLYVLQNKASSLNLMRASDGRVVQSSASVTWSVEEPIDVQLACTGTHYRGDCIGAIRSSYGPRPDLLEHAAGFGRLGPVAGRALWSLYINSQDSLEYEGRMKATTAQGEMALFTGEDITGTCREFRGGRSWGYGADGTALGAWDDPDLSDNVATVDDLPKASSAVTERGCPPPSGVVICADRNFGGTCEVVTGNVADVNGTSDPRGKDVRHDEMSSLYMAAGGTVSLYSEPNWEGTCETFRGSDLALEGNPIGDNRVSSIWLGHDCRDDVQLCEHKDLGGRCVVFRSDQPSLGSTDIGNDTASSVRVPGGWQISVHSDDHYRGSVDLFNGPVTRNFGGGFESYGAPYVTTVPNDAASSLDIRARPFSANPCTDRYGCLSV